MDSNNRRNLNRMFPDFKGFLPFLSRDVADPWYTGDFEITYRDLMEGCTALLHDK
jgi:protein-tyrosine phosphatase